MPDHRPHPRVVAVAYHGLRTLEFGCAYEIFGLPRPELDGPWYRFDVCAAEPDPLGAAGGLFVQAPYDPALIERADTVFRVGGIRPNLRPGPSWRRRNAWVRVVGGWFPSARASSCSPQPGC